LDLSYGIQAWQAVNPRCSLEQDPDNGGDARGKYEGYDDVRLGTISAVKRRGIVPEALKQIIVDLGITRTDSTLSWDTLYTQNRRS